MWLRKPVWKSAFQLRVLVCVYTGPLSVLYTKETSKSFCLSLKQGFPNEGSGRHMGLSYTIDLQIE